MARAPTAAVAVMFAVLVGACGAAGDSDRDAGELVDGGLVDEPAKSNRQIEQETSLLATAPDSGWCGVDADCVKTRATCCPCTAGGFEVAVNAATAAEIAHLLEGCSMSPGCNLSYTCVDQEVRCISSACQFVDAGT